jgi:dTDP-4-dehydrorhamnose reductase
VEVNARGTELVARAVGNARVKLVYASTDAVFPGDAPPYREQDPPAPLSVYGHSKLAGEKHVLAVPGALVVRMSALYSADLGAPNNVLTGLKESLEAGRTVPADDRVVRYYTLAEGVAAAVAFLVARGARGIVHVSAEERSTKLEFFRAAADAMGLDAGLVLPAELPAGSAPRPRDSHLDTSLYSSLAGPPFEGYRQALGRLRARGPGLV